MTDTRLYSEAFTGCALAIPRCPFCLQDDHTSPCCPNNPDQPWLHPQRAVSQAQPTPAPRQGPVAEICRRYNEGRCRYMRCRFTHACRTCGGQHPQISYSAQQGPRRSRSPLRPPAPTTVQKWQGPHLR